MTIQIRDALRAKGYRAKSVNLDCYDIDQEGRTHYLSAKEGQELNDSSLPHPVSLDEYGERRGLNTWYTFDRAST